MSGPGTTERIPEKYRVEIIVTWTIVGIPLVYGVYNALKAALQLFSG